MTQKDKELIARAKKLHYTQWMEVSDLADQADTQECRNRLEVIRTRMYHREEFEAHLL